MNYKISTSLLLASMLTFIFIADGALQGRGSDGAGNRDQQTDRDHDFDRDSDYTEGRDPVRDRSHMTDPASVREQDIYGNALMSEEELKQYRKQLMNMETDAARECFQAQHEAKMQERAQLQGKDLVPPGQGPIYGGELMTVQERNQYREHLRKMDSDEERQKYQAQHREQMELRAIALKLEIKVAE